MKLGITTIQRNREPWIREWIAFHYLVGFRHFYIFLHQCADDTAKILKQLQTKLDIKIFNVNPSLTNPQLKCYQDSYMEHGDEVDWMAFIDSDEFLFPTAADSMETALDEFSDKKISALGVYWSCFGSSGHIEEPLGLIVENYRYRADYNFEPNRHIKSLVRGGLGNSVKIIASHLPQTPFGTFDENLRPITYGLTDYQPTYKKFRINHYVCQSRSYYLNYKKNIGHIDSGTDYKIVRDEDWWQEHDINDVVDNSMDRFIPQLKKLMANL